MLCHDTQNGENAKINMGFFFGGEGGVLTFIVKCDFISFLMFGNSW